MTKTSFYEKIHKATISEPYLDADMVNLNYTSHFHEEIEIIYVVSGSVTLFVNGNTYIASCGDIGIIMPGEIHSYSSKRNHVYIIKIIPPNNDEITNFSLLRLKNNLITNKNSIVYTDVKSIILKIFEEYKTKNKWYKIAINKNTLELILTILRNLDCEIVSGEEKRRIANQLQLLKTVNEYVESNYTSTIALKDVSKQCGYSLYYFAHLFKETSNISFVEYLSSYRAEKARQLILMSDKKLTDIAFLCGFNNIRSFNRAFKKRYNTTPSEYRKLSPYYGLIKI